MIGSSSMSPYLQMMMQMQGQNPFASPQGGLPPQSNMAPQIPIAQQRQGGPVPAPQINQPIRPPGGNLGTGVQGLQNIQKLYGMGNSAYNSLFGPNQSTPSGTSPAMNGASNLSGQANAQNFMGPMGNPSPMTSGMSSGMPPVGGSPNYSGYGMAGPSAGGMFGGQQGANAAFMNGGSGSMFGSGGGMGQSGASLPGSGGGIAGTQLGGSGAFFNGTAGGAGQFAGGGGLFAGQGGADAAGAGQGAADAAATDAASSSSSSPSWLDQLWEML